MHPAIRSSKVGRIRTRQIDFPFHEQTMPSPPKEAKEAHDYIVRHSIPDPAGLRTERKWQTPGNFPSPPKFCRLYSHARVLNTCEREEFFLIPAFRRLQCFYFPRPPMPEKKRMCDSRKVKRNAGSFCAKEDLWGAWDPRSQALERKEALRMRAEIEAGDRKHTNWFYSKHRKAIEALREMHKRGESNYKSWQPPENPPKPIPKLRIREELDLEAVIALKHWKPNIDELVSKGFSVI